MEKQKLPYAQSSLIFGVISIITACCCLGLPGLIFGIIGLNNSKKALNIYQEDASQYDGIGNANTGRITSIIGIVLGSIAVLQIIYAISTGTWQESIEMYQDLIEQST